MEESSVFDKLVEELCEEERRDLLRKIESAISVSDEPLRGGTEGEPEEDTESVYRSLNFFLRLLYALKALFSGKSPLEAFENGLLSKLKKTINHETPKLADFHRSLFLERMKTELEGLKESAEYFRKHLPMVWDQNRGEFIAFLVRCHCEILMTRLEDETDPRNIVAEGKISEEGDLKGEMDRRFAAIVSEIPEEDRKLIYLDYQALDYLKVFSEIDPQAIISRFGSDSQPGGPVCAFSAITKRLIHLAGVLKSVNLPPSKIALKALFLYTRRNDRDDLSSFEQFLKTEFGRAGEALVRIRTFNSTIPLERIAKILMGDYNYHVLGLSGGEDWFVLFKKYWQARLVTHYKNYIRDLRTTTAVEKCFLFLGIRKFEEIKHYAPPFYGMKIIPAHWRSLSFILAFYKNIFVPKFLKSLKLLFLNGEFYKTENRVEYADIFNFLSTLNEKLYLFEKKLSPSGELGKTMEEMRAAKEAPDVLAKKLEPLVKKADQDALTMVEKTIASLKVLNRLLNGILYSDAGGRYDTLANISYIGGRENQLLRKDWEKVITLSYEASQLLYELRVAEAPK